MGFVIKDILDILIVAVLLYLIYRLMKRSGALPVFLGVIVFVIFWFIVTNILKLGLTGAILNQIVSVGSIALVVIFQDEIRRLFLKLGSSANITFYKRVKALFQRNDQREEFPTKKLVVACRNLSRSKTGALIAISRENKLTDYIHTGDIINADINTRLIENIFFKNSPLHDGAMIITGNRIASAGSILPVSNDVDIPRNLGLRHRAALGLSERTDAVVIIVSEETGSISMAIDGAYRLDLTPEDLQSMLDSLFNKTDEQKEQETADIN